MEPVRSQLLDQFVPQRVFLKNAGAGYPGTAGRSIADAGLVTNELSAGYEHFSDLGKNDLWIAATASTYALTLVTTDQDFGHLKDIYLKLSTINPEDFR